jgi:hypothetical protein
MRARPSKTQDEGESREFAARLVSQHTRLAMHLAAVLNRKTVDAEVMKRTRKVALDTARGITLKIAKVLYETGEDGAEAKYVCHHVGEEDYKIRNMLSFLRKIEVVTSIQKKQHGMTSKPLFHLTPKIRKLYHEVVASHEGNE